MVLDFLAVDDFDFTRKIGKTNLGEKLVKLLGFGQKFDFSNSVYLCHFLCSKKGGNTGYPNKFGIYQKLSGHPVIRLEKTKLIFKFVKNIFLHIFSSFYYRMSSQGLNIY